MSTEVGGHSTKVPSAWMRKRTVAGQKPPHRSRNQALNPGQSGTRYDAPKRAKNAELRNKAHSPGALRPKPARTAARTLAGRSSPQQVHRFLDVGHAEIPCQRRMLSDYLLIHCVSHSPIGEMAGLTAAQLGNVERFGKIHLE